MAVDAFPSSPFPQPAPPALELDGLTRRFGNVTAVDRVSLRIAAGETFGLIGPNGAGKSTLMKMLTTLLPPSAGVAQVAGFDLAHRPQQVRARIGYVPQLPSADGELTGYENMLLSARLYLVPRAERRATIAASLDLMGLTEVQHRLVQTYSGGMARRLEVAQSTMHRPAILFLDEPTVGLDPAGRATVWKHVRDLRDRIGAAVIFSTHYMEEAEDLCDRIALINAGRIVAIGSPADLKTRFAAATLDDLFAQLAGDRLPAAAMQS